MCDSKSADARLFTHRFFNEREMSYALLVDTARILQAVGDDIPVFPGWESVAHVLAFLKTEIRRTGSTTSSPLRCFLLSVCVCLRPPRIFPRPLNAALLHSPNCPCAPPPRAAPSLWPVVFAFPIRLPACPRAPLKAGVKDGDLPGVAAAVARVRIDVDEQFDQNETPSKFVRCPGCGLVWSAEVWETGMEFECSCDQPMRLRNRHQPA